MKKSFLFFIPALAMLFGAGAALINVQPDANSVNADHSISISNSGSIYLQLNTNEWKMSGQKIVLYMWNSSSNAWGGFVSPNGSSRFVEYSYNLSFTPTGCKVFRLNPDVQTAGSWIEDNYHSNSAVWGYTEDLSFNHVLWLGEYNGGDYNKRTNAGSYSLNAVVKGGASDSWSQATVDASLTNAKINDSDNIEVYGEVNLPVNTYFKVVKEGNNWCGIYSSAESISNYLTGGGESNIRNKLAGKYMIYFDYDATSSYIESPIISSADTWSTSFLSGVGCDANGSSLPTGWSTVAGAYSNLADDVKDFIYGINADENGISNTQKAVARYDYAVAHHSSLTRFIVNRSGTERPVARIVSAPQTISSITSTSATAVVVAVTVISLTTIGGYIYLRKRKEN